MLLITRGSTLLGTLVRSDLDASSGESPHPDEPALSYASITGRTIGGSEHATSALSLLVSRGERRRAVVDSDGVLLGLLCVKRHGRGFCSDTDVESRAADSADWHR